MDAGWGRPPRTELQGYDSASLARIQICSHHCKQWIQENHTQVLKHTAARRLKVTVHHWGEQRERNPIHWEFELIPKVWIHKTVHCVFPSWKCFLGFLTSLQRDWITPQSTGTMGSVYHLEKFKFNFLLSDFLECLFCKALYRVVFSLFLFPTLLKKEKKFKSKPSYTFSEPAEACLWMLPVMDCVYRVLNRCRMLWHGEWAQLDLFLWISSDITFPPGLTCLCPLRRKACGQGVSVSSGSGRIALPKSCLFHEVYPNSCGLLWPLLSLGCHSAF